MSVSFIEKLEEELPELCTDQDLIRVGLFASPQCLFSRRQKGKSPPYFQFGRCVRYQKSDVISWVRKCFHNQEVKYQ